jgi:hypothetical protein
MPQLNQRDAIHYIANREEFTASALSGTADIMSAGRLNNEEAEKYNKERDFIHYVVYSYNTPIAWHTLGGWYIVSQKFSQTTSKHQNLTRRAIADSLAGVN